MSLDSLRQEIANHPSNTWALNRGYFPVFTASPSAKIAIIGQAPGRKAQESGLSWNDISGDTLRTWLGLSRDQFYSPDIALMAMDFYYPGKANHGDLPPRKDFAPLWHPKLFAEMPELKLTILVGAYSQKEYLGKTAKANLTETVRSYKEYLPNYLPLVHPSPLNFRWRRNNPWFGSEVLPDARHIVSELL